MSWSEFRTLLSGLGPDTPLARTVQIRLEDNPKVIEQFTSVQHRIRDKWRARNAKQYTEDDMNAILSQFQQAFMSL